MARVLTNPVIHFWIYVLQFWAFRDRSIIGPYDAEQPVCKSVFGRDGF
jgi:hypothetical protein